MGGQITAEANNIPVCMVNNPVSTFGPCPGPSTGVCSYSAANFVSVCEALGGFQSATAGANGLPVCTVVG